MKRAEFAESAFKHAFRSEDFFELIAGRYLKIGSQKGLENIYELLGQNLAGNYLHIIYRVIDENTIRVFHIGLMSSKLKRRYKEFMKR